MLLSELLTNVYPDNDNYRIENVTSVSAINMDETQEAEIVRITEVENDYEIETVVGEEIVSGTVAQLIVELNDNSRVVFSVNVSGTPAVESDGLTISTVDGSYLPEGTTGSAELVEGKESIEKIEEQNETEEDPFTEGVIDTSYQVFDIKLDLTEEQLAGYEAGFKVDLNLPENLIGKDFHLYHIHDDVLEELDIEKAGRVVDEETGLEVVSGISFITGGFSDFVLSYTVDFTFEGFTYKLSGEGSMLLSSLLSALHIDLDLSEIKFVSFTDDALLSIEKTNEEVISRLHNRADRMLRANEGSGLSDSELINIIYGYLGIPINKNINENDWLLTSLKSFDSEETLVIVTKNAVVYEINVTDPATQDISSLLTDVKIDATQNSDGSYTVFEGQPYGINLSFKENPNGLQFDMTNGFYYDIPSGLFNLEALSGKSIITLSGGDHAGEEVELDYHLEGNRLVFTWPDQTSGAYNQLKDAIYTSFNIHINGQFKENATQLKFNDKITKDVTVSTEGHAYVQKTGTYNAATNCIDYTVNVTSQGICKNVVVTDTISGTALTYNNDAIAASNKNSNTYTPTKSGNGFTFTIPQMGDNETVTVKYSAAVNLDALTRNEDGSLGTVEQTGNKVTATPSNHPGDDDEKSGKDFNNKITYSSISKKSSVGETGDNGHATVTWTIKANENTNVSMAGHTISDLIDSESQAIMKYSGTGITIVRRNSSGTVVGREETIPWNNLTTHSDSAWTWTVPNSYPDTDKLSYEITYTTDVDVSGKLFNTTVKNTGTSDNGGSSSGSGTVGPVGGPLAARKVVIGKDLSSEEKTVTWEVNFDVPSVGLDSAEIIDTLPIYYENSSIYAIDSYKTDSVVVTSGLAFGEHYEVVPYTDDSGKECLKIVFYKTENEQSVPGLSGTGSKRKVRVQFKTILDDDWLEEAKTDSNAYDHVNNADVILNGQTLQTKATVKIDTTEPDISKTHTGETVNVYNNNQLPAWQFFITLTGVSDETFDENGQIVITDTYNSKYLDWYPHAYESWETQNGQVWGGDSDSKFKKSSTEKVMEKVTDGELKITLNFGQLPMDDNGDYYPLYTIPYYLTVKDPIAQQKLISTATNTDGGSVALYNTASNDIFGDTEDKVDYEVPVVDKKATDPVLTNGIYKLHYTIDVNKKALQLGDSDELVLTDEYSNISVDYTTLKIYEVVTDQWGNLISRNEATDVVWDRSGYIVTYYLKNATHYQIEYDAHLSGEGEAINATQSKLTYTNTAEAFGQKSTWEKDKTIETGGSGESQTFRIKVLKHEKGNASKGLSGAKFKLFKYHGGPDDPAREDNPNGYNSRPDKNAPGWEDTGYTLTTDNSGYAHTEDYMHIHSQTWYKLVETDAPTGYTLKTTHYFFWITEGQVADYNNYVYINDDVLAINNVPELPETVDISVEKVWDDNSEKTLRRNITVHLYADGVPYNEYYSGDYAANARTDADVVLHLNEDGTTEGYTWKDLPSGVAYSVVEDPVPGYVIIYSPKNTLTSGTLRVTNKRNPHKTAISVDKVWSNGVKPAEDVTIQLKRKIAANAPVVIENGAGGNIGLHIKNYSVPAGANINLVWTYKNGDGRDTPALDILNYATGEVIVHREEISGSTHNQQTLNLTVPPEGIKVRFKEPYLDSEDSFNRQFDFDIQVVSNGSGGSTEDVNFTLERHTYTLSADSNWHLDIGNLVLSDDDGSYTYYIEEIGVNDNTETPEQAHYTVSYSNNDGIENGTITVTNSGEKVDVSAKKEWVPSAPANGTVVFTLYSNGEATDKTVTLDGTVDNNGEAEAWVASFKDLIKYGDDGELIEYTVKETTGYTGYIAVTKVGEDYTVQSDSDTVANGGTIYNKEAKGNLEVTKELIGDVTGNEDKQFKVTIKNSSNKYLQSDTTTFGDTPYEFTVSKATKLKIENLPVDTYTVEEKTGTVYTDIITNYTWTGEGSTISGSQTLVNGETKTIELKNKYTEDKGNLEVTKELIGDVTGNEDKQFKVTIKNSSNKYLQSDTTTFGDSAYEFTVSKASKLTVENLPIDTYTVEEKTGTGYTDIIANYTWTSDGSTTTGSQTLVKDQTKTVALENKYERDKGSLKIQKSVTVNDQPIADTTLVDGDYTFNITGSDIAVGNSAKVKVTISGGVVTAAVLEGTPVPNTITVGVDGTGANAVAKVNGLPTGSYTVTEDTTGLAAKGITLASSSHTDITVEKDQTSGIPTATFVNNKNVGDLIVEKKVSGRTDTENTFSFEISLTPPTGVTLENSYPAEKTDASGTKAITTVSVSGNKITVSLKADEKIQVKNLPAGTTYSVTETGSLPSGYTQGDHSGNSGSISTGGTATATMKNTYDTSIKAKVEGTKEVKNGSADLSGYTFTLAPVDSAPMPASGGESATSGSDGKFSFGEITYTMANAKTGTNNGTVWTKEYKYKVSENLPSGYTATAEETAAGYKIINGIKYDLTEKEVTVTITYDESNGTMTKTVSPTQVNLKITNEQLGKLKLAKTLKVTDPAGEIDHDFTFTITFSGEKVSELGTSYSAVKTAPDSTTSNVPVTIAAGDNGTKTASVTLKAGETIEIKDLPIGVTYTITETDDPAYKVSSTTNDSNQTVTKDGVTTTFENERVLGKITVTKTVQLNGQNTDELGKDFWVAVYSDQAATTKVAGPKKISISGGTGTVEFDKLPIGTYFVYELTEENGKAVKTNGANTVGGHVYHVTTDNTDAVITKADLEGTASIINNDTKRGTLTVNKVTLYNEQPDDQVKDKKVKIGLYTDASASNPVKDPEDNTKSYVKEISLGDNGTGEVIFNELDFGHDYYVFEIADDGNAVTGTSATINGVVYTVSQDKTSVKFTGNNRDDSVTITNKSTEKGSIEVTKEIQVNGTKSEVLDGTFQVALYEVTTDNSGAEPIEIETQVGEVKSVTVTGGVSSTAKFENLTIGSKYRVYEVTVDGSTVTKIGTQYGQYTVSYENQTATIARGTGKDVTGTKVINNIETTSIKVDKKWFQPDETDVTETITNASISIQLKNGNEVVIADIDGTVFGTNGTVTLNGSESPKWSYEWTNLPKYNSNGQEINYSVVETSAKVETDKDGDTELLEPGTTVTAEAKNSSKPNELTLENTLPKTELEGIKTWIATGTHNNAEDITLKLTRTDGTVTESYYKGEPDAFKSAAKPEDPLKQPDWTGDNYKYSELPKYNNAGKEYTYSVEEVTFTTGSGSDLVTYTVTKNGNDYTVTSNPPDAPKFTVTQDGNNIVNEELTEFEFEKDWVINGTTPETWPKNGSDEDETITVVLTRSASGANAPSAQTVTFTVTSSSIVTEQGGTITGFTATADTRNSGANVTRFKYKITDLDKFWSNTVDETEYTGEWTYSLAETATSASGYTIRYKIGDVIMGSAESIPSGNIIINDKAQVSLPETGGSGTHPYTLGGSLILAFTALAYIFKKRRGLSLVPVEADDPRRGGGPRT